MLFYICIKYTLGYSAFSFCGSEIASFLGISENICILLCFTHVAFYLFCIYFKFFNYSCHSKLYVSGIQQRLDIYITYEIIIPINLVFIWHHNYIIDYIPYATLYIPLLFFNYQLVLFGPFLFYTNLPNSPPI